MLQNHFLPLHIGAPGEIFWYKKSRDTVYVFKDMSASFDLTLGIKNVSILVILGGLGYFHRGVGEELENWPFFTRLSHLRSIFMANIVSNDASLWIIKNVIIKIGCYFSTVKATTATEYLCSVTALTWDGFWSSDVCLPSGKTLVDLFPS